MHVALMFLVVVVKIYNRGLGCRRIKAFRFHYMFDCGLLDLRDALVFLLLVVRVSTLLTVADRYST